MITWYGQVLNRRGPAACSLLRHCTTANGAFNLHEDDNLASYFSEVYNREWTILQQPFPGIDDYVFEDSLSQSDWHIEKGANVDCEKLLRGLRACAECASKLRTTNLERISKTTKELLERRKTLKIDPNAWHIEPLVANTSCRKALQEDLSKYRQKKILEAATRRYYIADALQWIMKSLPWEERGIRVDGRLLSNLRFADDIVLFSRNTNEAQTVLNQLNEAGKRI
ncbi:hypothetical protein RB195_017749 [Necator americanus]|uniref:Reverse transcriptase domain-containing protein n=1 Tax=Necator americanus TaxID=51031 RepID=A0ABR1C9R1_NECAM